MVAAPVVRRDGVGVVVQQFFLAPRQLLEVLRLVGAGYSNSEIAEKLFLSLNTVKKHTSNIFGKLGVTSRTQAVAAARQLGLFKEE